MAIKVNVDLNGINARFSQGNVVNARRKVLNQMESDMQRFVPYRQGNLMKDVAANIDGTGLRYTQPYAAAQFYGFIANYKRGGMYPIRNYTTVPHPDAGRRWDLRAKGRYMADWSIVGQRAIMKEISR